MYVAMMGMMNKYRAWPEYETAIVAKACECWGEDVMVVR